MSPQVSLPQLMSAQTHHYTKYGRLTGLIVGQLHFTRLQPLAKVPIQLEDVIRRDVNGNI